MKIKNLLIGVAVGCFLSLLMLNTQVLADSVWPDMVGSADGVPISYEVHGTGEPTLVFVHGWSCDGRYWRMQVPHFSKNHRVVVIDLAGHGHSGLGREDYAMDAFGEDVQAVVKEVGAEQVILIGHSMGGPVSVAAARLMPGRVIGAIGVDTFHDVSHPMTREEFDSWMGLLQPDFPAGAAQFVRQMFIEKTDPVLRDWVVADMSAAPPKVALSAMGIYLGLSAIELNFLCVICGQPILIWRRSFSQTQQLSLISITLFAKPHGRSNMCEKDFKRQCLSLFANTTKEVILSS